MVYFHRAQELAEELREAGLAGVEVFDVDGPARSMLKPVGQSSGQRRTMRSTRRHSRPLAWRSPARNYGQQAHTCRRWDACRRGRLS